MNINSNEIFKKLNSENRKKLISALSAVTGRSQMSIKNHWFFSDSVPKEYKILVDTATKKIYDKQIEEVGVSPKEYTLKTQLQNLEKLLS